MPPAETGVTTLARAVLSIADDQFPIEMRGPGAGMIDVLAAKKGAKDVVRQRFEAFGTAGQASKIRPVSLERLSRLYQ